MDRRQFIRLVAGGATALQSRILSVLLAAFAGAMLYIAYWTTIPRPVKIERQPEETTLPEPVKKGLLSVEEALEKRRSGRLYTNESLTLQEVGQLLWAAQGVTESRWGFRTAPSAGGTYPLEVYIVVAKDGVKDLSPGIYRYIPQHHSILLVSEGDFRAELAVAALDQPWVAEAGVNIVISAVYERTTDRYGDRGVRYVYMEAGHVGQNIYLQTIALNLATVVIGAFHDDQVQRVVRMPDNEKPLYVIPIGRPSCDRYNDPKCIFR